MTNPKLHTKLHKPVNLGRRGRWIIWCGAVIIICLVVASGLFESVMWQELEFDSSHPRPMFSLTDTKYNYILVRSPNGAYMIHYAYEYQGKPNGINEFVGSSKVSLEPFVDKKVKITGEYRKAFGAPLCWDNIQCTENKLNKASFTVIDIERLEVL